MQDEILAASDYGDIYQIIDNYKFKVDRQILMKAVGDGFKISNAQIENYR